MLTQSTQTAIADLLAQTGAAHGEYEERDLGGAYDQNWAQWYATYLVGYGFGNLLDTNVTVEQVRQWLQACDAAYKQEQPNIRWENYYAQRIGDVAKLPS